MNERIPLGSTWESYDGTEIYLVVRRIDQLHVNILILDSSCKRQGHVAIAINGYLHAGRRLS